MKRKGKAVFDDFSKMKSSLAKRWRVINLRNDHEAIAAIRRKTGYNEKFVIRWAHAADQGRDAQDKPRSGRPPKLTDKIIKTIEKKMKGKKRASTRKISAQMHLSRSTINRGSKLAGLYPYHRCKKPLLSLQHQQRRLTFARDFANLPWKRTMMSDEKYFLLFPAGNSKNDVVYAKDGADVPPIPRVTKSAGIHVWAAISYYGKTKLVRIEGNLNAAGYVKILQRHMLPTAREVFRNGRWWYQQDGARPHTANITQKWLADNVPNFISKAQWPASSPDANCLENLWSYVDSRVQARNPKTIDGLWRIMKEEWKAIPQSLLKKLFDSQPVRLQAIIAANGGTTKY